MFQLIYIYIFIYIYIYHTLFYSANLQIRSKYQILFPDRPALSESVREPLTASWTHAASQTPTASTKWFWRYSMSMSSQFPLRTFQYVPIPGSFLVADLFNFGIWSLVFFGGFSSANPHQGQRTVSVHPSDLQRHSSWTSLTWYRLPWLFNKGPTLATARSKLYKGGPSRGWGWLNTASKAKVQIWCASTQSTSNFFNRPETSWNPKRQTFGISAWPATTSGKFGLVAAYYWEYRPGYWYARPDAYCIYIYIS